MVIFIVRFYDVFKHNKHNVFKSRANCKKFHKMNWVKDLHMLGAMEDDLRAMEDDLRATEDDLELMGEGPRLMLGLMEDDYEL